MDTAKEEERERRRRRDIDRIADWRVVLKEEWKMQVRYACRKQAGGMA
jgi:hypothetical protein